jgi:hypothetical protein
MKLIRFLLLALICLVATELQAAEGVLIVQKFTSPQGVRTSQAQIEKQRMRVETTGDNGKQVTMFDGEKQVLTTVNYARKTYTELTKEEMEQMSAQVSGAMTQMQGRMANVPPEQRARIEAMMRGRMGAAAGAAKTEYRQVGTDKVAKWTCDKYEGYENNQKTVELCTVDPKALGLSISDFDVAKQMMEFMKTLLPPGMASRANSDVMFVGTPDVQGYSGIPVRQTSFSGGKPVSTSELVDVSRQNFPASNYEIPTGFQKEARIVGRGRP